MQFCFSPVDPANLAAGYGFTTVLDGQDQPAGAYCISIGEYCSLSSEEIQAKLSEYFSGATAVSPTPTASPQIELPQVSLEPTPEPTPEESPEESPEPEDEPDKAAAAPKSARGRK